MSTNETALQTAEVTPAGSPPAAAPPAEPAGSPPAPGSVGGSPPPSPESPNLRQLREQYEHLKSEYEPWKKLGVPAEAVSQQMSLLGQYHREAIELGMALGFDQQEVTQVFAQDPLRVLNYLRQQAQSRPVQNPTVSDLRRQMDQMVEQRLAPITAREDQRLNLEAEGRFNQEFDRLFKDNFKDGLPDEARAALSEMVGQLVGDDPEAIQRLKFQGQTSDVAKYFEAAKTRLLSIMNSYIQHERKRTGGELPPPPGQPPKPKSRMDATVAGGIPVRELFNI